MASVSPAEVAAGGAAVDDAPPPSSSSSSSSSSSLAPAAAAAMSGSSPAKRPQLKAVIVWSHGGTPPKKDEWYGNMARWLEGIADVVSFTYAFAAKGRTPKVPLPDELVPEHLAQLTATAAAFPDTPIFVAGKGLGGRVGLMAAAAAGAPAAVRGAVCFGFQLVKDGEAYRRLKKDGIQPKGTTNVAMLEQAMDHKVEAKMGRSMTKAERLNFTAQAGPGKL